jgi:hypothetical protein
MPTVKYHYLDHPSNYLIGRGPGGGAKAACHWGFGTTAGLQGARQRASETASGGEFGWGGTFVKE